MDCVQQLLRFIVLKSRFFLNIYQLSDIDRKKTNIISNKTVV